jgi:hypothetical protein
MRGRRRKVLGIDSRPNGVKAAGSATPTGYLRSATWKDVMRGQPVTVEELRASAKRSRRVDHRCRECGRVGKTLKLRRVKCPECGGTMDPIRPGAADKPNG